MTLTSDVTVVAAVVVIVAADVVIVVADATARDAARMPVKCFARSHISGSWRGRLIYAETSRKTNQKANRKRCCPVCQPSLCLPLKR